MMEHRVSVRPYAASDADDVYAAVRESLVEVGRWMPWCHPGYAPEHARSWMDATVAGWASGSMYEFAVFVDGAYAGGCGINRINTADRVANLGYWVRTSVAGRGVATAAALEVIRWAFEHTTLNRIEIVAACGNVPSQRVAEKVGATRDAVLRKRTLVGGQPVDAVLYSVVRP